MKYSLDAEVISKARVSLRCQVRRGSTSGIERPSEFADLGLLQACHILLKTGSDNMLLRTYNGI